MGGGKKLFTLELDKLVFEDVKSVFCYTVDFNVSFSYILFLN